jgi:type IV pilus biogenesis protein CpaD/CtpE
MKATLRLLAFAAVAPLALAACENPAVPKQTLHPAFGDAVRHNMAVQILNPEGHPDLSPPPMDGTRAAGAVERYRTGKTEEVVEQRTSDVGSAAK